VGLLLVGGRNSQHQQRKKSKSLLPGLMLGLVLGSLAGCGGHQSKTVMFNVIASSGGASHSTTVTLTIRH
jgi:hypothetical protein